MPIWSNTPLKTIVSGYIKAHGTAMIEITFVNKKEGIVNNPFKRKPAPSKSDLIASIDDITNEEKNEYNDTLNYLVSLSDDDYEKMLKCAKVYREADKKVAAIMETKAPNGGDVIEVRVVPKDKSSDSIETDDEKGKQKNATKAK